VEVLLALLVLVPFALAVLWLLSLRGEGDEEELAGLAAGNWPQVREYLSEREP
jgi:hypothetical protein